MSTNSKVLALKYRPKLFSDLIGQEVVSDTIYNSIKYDKIPNAFLFTGIRGVGKTTIARLIAKALNCKNGIDNIGNQNSCENCHCEAIAKSNHIDVLEMDAASKTGVDDVRDLIEFSKYGPTSSKYKIFIIDEVHMLSKQAFNALLKTLEEPPEYLKFIFATTELKKIPVTILSRCQRFDLSRVRSEELLMYIKKICNLENGNISDEALKLIVKISEGSVRDSLSLLDRALLSNDKEKRLELSDVQKIFGYFDKSHLIKIFEYILKGDQNKTLEAYKNIYNQGVEPKIFLNDFLEILYYFKNINSLNESTKNFDLNNDEFEAIKEIAMNLNSETLILFWQFTINTLGELDIVADQNISIEMFLIRLLHIKSIKMKDSKDHSDIHIKLDEKKLETKIQKKQDPINQIKSIVQEKSLGDIETNKIKTKNISIKSLSDLIDLCNVKKEVKLKYELENNVNLLSFEHGRIEISINEKLEKDFIKILSAKLLEWTKERWMITLSKKTGEKSKKESDEDAKNKLFENAKKTETYKKILQTFSDAELIDIEIKKDE
jgi:DNA polymerase-3 subunit gamma/tau